MKDEIPQAVIDSHVKNAAIARTEKAKQDNAEESAGRVQVLYLFYNAKPVHCVDQRDIDRFVGCRCVIYEGCLLRKKIVCKSGKQICDGQ